MAQPKSSKQKRAAQNKASRQALAARRDNAQVTERAGSSASASGSGRSSNFGKLRGLFNPAPPPKKTTTAASSGGTAGGGTGRGAAAARTSNQPVGYRAAMSAVFASVAAVVLCLVAVPVAINAAGDLYTRESLATDWSITAAHAVIDAPDATPAELVKSIDEWTPGRETKPALVALWPWSAAVIFPVAGTLLGFRAVKRRLGSKTVSRFLFLTVLGVLTTTQLAFLFLPSIIALGVAMYQVRKYEARTALAVGDATTGEVIEADVVEVDPDDVDG